VNKPKAKYQIEDTFKVTGRGAVFAGTIIEGAIGLNDLIEFDFRDDMLKRRIIGIESIRSIPEKKNIGILIECKDEAEINELRNWDPNYTLAQVYDRE